MNELLEQTITITQAAGQAIMGGKIKKGDVIVIRYEGPMGGPGMREMLTPTSAIAGMKLSDSNIDPPKAKSTPT